MHVLLKKALPLQKTNLFTLNLNYIKNTRKNAFQRDGTRFLLHYNQLSGKESSRISIRRGSA